MSSQSHIIKKQILEVHTKKKEAAPVLQEKVKKLYYERLQPMIEQYFDSFGQTGTLYRIDKLELKLEKVNPDNLDEDFTQKFEKKLVEKLNEKITSVVDFTELVSLNHKPRLPKELLTYFFKTGVLPWWADKDDSKILEKTFLNTLESSPERLKTILLRAMQHELSLKRLIFAFDDKIHLKSISLLAIDKQDFIANLCNELDGIFQEQPFFKSADPVKLRLEKWKGIFFTTRKSQQNMLDKKAFAESVLLHLSTSLRLSYVSMLKAIRKDHSVFGLLSPLTQMQQQVLNDLKESLKAMEPNVAEAIERILKEMDEGIVTTKLIQNLTKILLTLSQQELSEGLLEQVKMLRKDLELHTKIGRKKTVSKDKIEVFEFEENLFDESDETFINNAGLVLIYPFLLPYFKTVGLATDETFINQEAAERAALLLQYIANGSEETAEYLLPLNKVLCGLEVGASVASSIKVTEQEHKEAEEMLGAVIHHWPKLNNLPINAFRGAYFQREGVLMIQDGNWLLRVERKAYDLIVDDIPWGFKHIKLPWMQNMLLVEW